MSLIAFAPPSIGPSSNDATEASGRQIERGTDGLFGATLDHFANRTARYNAPEESPAHGSTSLRPDNHDRFLKRIDHDRSREIDDSSSSVKASEAEEVDGELTPDGQRSGTTEVETPDEPQERDPKDDPTYASPGPLTLLATLSAVATAEGNSPSQPTTQSDAQNMFNGGDVSADRPITPVAPPTTTELKPAPVTTPITSTDNAFQSGDLSTASNVTAQRSDTSALTVEPATVQTTATKVNSAATDLALPDAVAFNGREVSASAESLNAVIAHPLVGVSPSAAEWGNPDHDGSTGTQDNGQNNDAFISTITTFAHSAQSKSQVDATALRSSPAAHQVVDLTRTAVVLRDRGHGPRLEATLSPPDLGRIRIELQGRGDSLTVRIQVAESQTLQLLQNSLSDLRQQLQSLGLDSDTIAITGWTEHTTHGQPDSRDNTTDHFTRDEAHPMFKSRPMLAVPRKVTQLVDVIL